MDEWGRKGGNVSAGCEPTRERRDTPQAVMGALVTSERGRGWRVMVSRANKTKIIHALASCFAFGSRVKRFSHYISLIFPPHRQISIKPYHLDANRTRNLLSSDHESSQRLSIQSLVFAPFVLLYHPASSHVSSRLPHLQGYPSRGRHNVNRLKIYRRL